MTEPPADAHGRPERERRHVEDEFWQSQKLEAVGRLANLFAHDFNNLLMVIQGYTDLLIADSSDQAKREARLGQIRSAAEAAGRLSSQLLALSHRNTGVAEAVDLNLLVRVFNGVLQRVLPANVEKSLVLAVDLGLTLVDPGQVDQILMNLITNALDAMPEGGRLTIRTASRALGLGEASAQGVAVGAYVALSVTDSGVGLDAAEPEPGLGLAVVRAMVRRLGGEVTVERAPGRSSTLTALFPRVPEPPPAAPAQSSG